MVANAAAQHRPGRPGAIVRTPTGSFAAEGVAFGRHRGSARVVALPTIGAMRSPGRSRSRRRCLAAPRLRTPSRLASADGHEDLTMGLTEVTRGRRFTAG